MKRCLWPLLLIVPVLALGSITALAAVADDTPKISSFTSTYAKVDRAGLANRTARVPVEWTTVNRPLTANLLFEQVLPDNSSINVELPRVIPWVSSSGKGTAAPILPASDAASIVLRVRLVNLLTGQTLDEQRLTLPVDTVSGQSSNAGGRSTITRFVTPTVNVRPDALKNRTARVGVSWTAINRAVTSNLVFEQIMPDGSARNVELPRDNPWVASAGDGVAAPFWPGDNAAQIMLRVRLVDLLTGRVLDQRSLTVQVDATPTPAAKIRYFITGANSVDAVAPAQHTARIPVSWDVDNRQPDTNLIFEQVIGQSAINVELPRNNPWVSSPGTGVVAPVLPTNSGLVSLRLRLINTTTQATLDSREIHLPIIGYPGATSTPVPSATPPYTAQVVTFTADKSAVHQGDSIRMTWDVRNVDHVSLTLTAWGQTEVKTHIEDLPASGSTMLTIPQFPWGSSKKAIVNLNGYTSRSGDPTFTVPYVLTLACDTHFTSDASNDCAMTEPVQVGAAYETFERGFMVWDGNSKTIWVLYNNGRADRAADSWTNGDITFSDPTPAGRTLPQHGFGQLWTSNEIIRNAIGWALGPEQGYTGTFQMAATADTGVRVDYITTPDGHTFRVQDFGWSLMQ